MTVVKSRIDSVTVYHRGATVSRLVELVPLEGGELPGEIEINRLPLALVDPTVRIRVDAIEPTDAELTVTNLRVGLFAEPRKGEEPNDARDELKKVERALRQVNQTIKHVEIEMSYLTQMEVPSRPGGEEGKPPPASPLSARVALENFTDEAVQQRVADVRQLRARRKELREKAAELNDLIWRASTEREIKPHELSKTVVASLKWSGPAMTSARLLLEYYIPGARWAPAYQCRLSRDCTEADLQMRALVSQLSGEDWQGARLRLSTASPLSWSELPELSSIRIGRAQHAPASKRGFRPPPTGGQNLFVDFDRDRSLTSALLPPPLDWSAPAMDAFQPEVVPDPHAYNELRADGFDDDASIVGELADEECMEPMEMEIASAAPMAAGAPPPAPQPAARPEAQVARRAKPSPRKAKKSRQRAPVASKTELFDRLDDVAIDIGAVVFTHLRLGAPSNVSSRGRLEPEPGRATYLELLARAQAEVRIDVLGVVNDAQQAAANVASAPLPAGAADVRGCAGHFDYTYEADDAVDVPADGTFHSVALGTRRATSNVRYIVVPREDTSAYRISTLANPLAAPLLPGPVEVHVGGEYVLSTTLPTVAPGGQFELGLGVEQAIKVARNTHFSEERSGAKVVAMTELAHDIAIDLINHLPREVLCEIRERIPQPDVDAEVVVEEQAVDPPWEPYDQRERGRYLEGGRRWEIKLGSGERKELKAGYVVKIYANNEVVGGNRREA